MLTQQQSWRLLSPAFVYARIAGLSTAAVTSAAAPFSCRTSDVQPVLYAGLVTCTDHQQHQPVPAQAAVSSAYQNWVPRTFHSTVLTSGKTQHEGQQPNVQHESVKPRGQQHQQPQGKGQPFQRPPVIEGPKGELAAWRELSSEWWDESGFSRNFLTIYKLPSITTWSVLYQPPPTGVLSLLHYLLSHWRIFTRLVSKRHYHKWQADYACEVAPNAHEDFDSEGFRKGVQQALQHSTALYAASDWVSLKPLVSHWLLLVMQRARQEQAGRMDANNVTVDDVTLEINPASVKLVAMSSLTSKQLDQFDSQRAQDTLPLIPVGAEDEESATVDPAAAAAAAALHAAIAAPVAEGAADRVMWDVAHVYAEGVLHTRVVRDGAARHVDLPKKGHLLFCRGPVYLSRTLSEEQASRTPWFLLSWL